MVNEWWQERIPTHENDKRKLWCLRGSNKACIGIQQKITAP